MNETINVDDFIVLGKAAPDELRDFRKTVCYAGYSEQHGLMRIYPVPPSVSMKRWSKVEVSLERNSKDNRKESWKVKNSQNDWFKMSEKFKVNPKLPRNKQIELLQKLNNEYGVTCIQDLNERKLSLGLIKPKTFEPYFEKRENVDPEIQTTLSDEPVFFTKKNYMYRPRLKYACQDCRLKREYHDQQLLEWEVYEWMRKNPDNLDQAWINLGLDDPDFSKYFLVGNQARYHNSFMIISILRFKHM